MSTMNTDDEFAEIDTTEAEFDAMWNEAERSAATSVTNLWVKGGTATVAHQSGHAMAVHALGPGVRFALDHDAAVLI